MDIYQFYRKYWVNCFWFVIWQVLGVIQIVIVWHVNKKMNVFVKFNKTEDHEEVGRSKDILLLLWNFSMFAYTFLLIMDAGMRFRPNMATVENDRQLLTYQDDQSLPIDETTHRLQEVRALLQRFPSREFPTELPPIFRESLRHEIV